MENLDELLASLENDPRKSTTARTNPPSRIGSIAVDFDIDAYLEQLSTREGSSAGSQRSTHASLASAGGNKSIPPSARSSMLSIDELDELLSDNSSRKPTLMSKPPAQFSAELSQSRAPAKSLSPSDIDALFDPELSSATAKPAASSRPSVSKPPAASPPTQRVSSLAIDDVDALLKELEQPPQQQQQHPQQQQQQQQKQPPPPQQPKPQKRSDTVSKAAAPPAAGSASSPSVRVVSPRESITMAEVDRLLADMESAPRQSQPAEMVRGSLTLQDIDALLGDSSSVRASAAGPGAARPLSSSPLAGRPGSVMSLNQVAELLEDTPAPAPAPADARISRSPAGGPPSVRVEDLDELLGEVRGEVREQPAPGPAQPAAAPPRVSMPAAAAVPARASVSALGSVPQVERSMASRAGRGLEEELDALLGGPAAGAAKQQQQQQQQQEAARPSATGKSAVVGSSSGVDALLEAIEAERAERARGGPSNSIVDEYEPEDMGKVPSGLQQLAAERDRAQRAAASSPEAQKAKTAAAAAVERAEDALRRTMDPQLRKRFEQMRARDEALLAEATQAHQLHQGHAGLLSELEALHREEEKQQQKKAQAPAQAQAVDPELEAVERETMDPTRLFQDTEADLAAKRRRQAQEESKRKEREDAKFRQLKERQRLQMAEAILHEEGAFSALDTVELDGGGTTYFAWNVHMGDVMIKEKLGVGEHGQVHRAIYKDQQVTVKKLRAPPLTEEFLKSLRQEVSQLTMLSHPALFHFHGVILPGSAAPPGTPGAQDLHTVAEYVQGIPLYGYLRNRAVSDDLDAKGVLRWALQIAEALAYLHANRVMHRSLKSKNIIVDRDSHLRIRDHGLAAIKDWVRLQSAAPPALGAVEYEAPELLARRKYTEKVDVYAFGILLVEMFAKEGVYGRDRTPEQIVDGVLRDGLRPQIPIDAPFLFIKLIESCWQTEAELRPSFEKIVRILSQPADKILSWAAAS